MCEPGMVQDLGRRGHQHGPSARTGDVNETAEPVWVVPGPQLDRFGFGGLIDSEVLQCRILIFRKGDRR